MCLYDNVSVYTFVCYYDDDVAFNDNLASNDDSYNFAYDSYDNAENYSSDCNANLDTNFSGWDSGAYATYDVALEMKVLSSVFWVVGFAIKKTNVNCDTWDESKQTIQKSFRSNSW